MARHEFDMALIDDLIGPAEPVADVIEARTDGIVGVADFKLDRLLSGHTIVEQLVMLTHDHFVPSRQDVSGQKIDAVVDRLRARGMRGTRPPGTGISVGVPGEGYSIRTTFQHLGDIMALGSRAVVMQKFYSKEVDGQEVGREREILAFSERATKKALEKLGMVPPKTIEKFELFEKAKVWWKE